MDTPKSISRRDVLRFIPLLGELVSTRDFGPNPANWSEAAKAALGVHAVFTAALLGCSGSSTEGSLLRAQLDHDSMSAMLPPRLQNDLLNSGDVWSTNREQWITTNSGDIKVFNGSGIDLNIGLIRDIAQSCATEAQYTKQLDVRIFADMAVTRGGQYGWELSTNPNAEKGLTVSGQHLVVSVVPTGWTGLVSTYASSYPDLPPLNKLSPAQYATLNLAHELCGHGIPRAVGLEDESADPERTAQIYERVLLPKLNGRTIIR